MSQIHGKQVKDTSILLTKINPITGQTLTLAGTSKIQQAAAPTVGTDLANKDYVDSVAQGLDIKASVRVGTTANISIVSAPASIDGVTLASTNRILVKNQTTGSENGIYIFNGTGSPLTRSTDADTSAKVTAGMFTFIEEGTQSDTGWVLTTDNTIILGTTSLSFSQFSSAGIITASNGLTKTGNNITLGGTMSSNISIDGSFAFSYGATTPLTSYQVNSSAVGISASTSALVSSPIVRLETLTGNNKINIFNTAQAVTNNGSNNNMIVTDTTSTKGLVYAADYSANFTPESLVTKRYVDTNGSKLVTVDKSIIASTTTASGQQISSGITTTPKSGSYVIVSINGLIVTLGDGVTNREVYFANPALAPTFSTARAYSAIVSGDVLVRGSALVYNTDATDIIEYNYEA